MNNKALILTSNEPDSSAYQTRANPPGLSALTYRGGQYQTTRARMLARLALQDTLARLNPDVEEDWSIALIHAWAIVTDVLGFYQERIVNEGFIRTVHERRSVLALARAVGYQWRPGVAAGAYLALTVAPDDQDQPQRVTVRQGSAIHSTPGEDQLPQTFETSTDTEVRTAWNLLQPVVRVDAGDGAAREPFRTDTTYLRIAGFRTDLEKDDRILLVDLAAVAPLPATPSTAVTDPATDPATVADEAVADEAVLERAQGDNTTADEPSAPEPAWVLGTLAEVVADPQRPYTFIRWTVDEAHGTEIQVPALFVFRAEAKLFGYAQGAIYFDAEIPPAPAEQTEATGADTTTNPSNGTGTTAAADANASSPTANQTASRADTGADTGTNLTPPVAPVTDTGTIGGAIGGATVEPNGDSRSEGDSEAEVPEPKAANWIPRTFRLPNLDINALVTNRRNILFAATKQDLYRSFDFGDSWQAAGVDLVQRNVTALALDPEDTLFAATNTGGIYRSYDNGDNWTAISGDNVAPDIKVVSDDSKGFTVEPPDLLPKAPIKELVFGPDKKGNTVFYAATAKELFVSTNQGKSWTPIGSAEAEMPAVQQRPTSVDQRQAMLAVAQTLLVASPVAPLLKAAPWVTRVVNSVAKGAGTTKWVGLDLWDFLRSGLRTAPDDITAIRAVAVAPKAAGATVVVGTDKGKFTVKERTRRWLVAAVIVVLVLFQQFLTNRGTAGVVPIQMTGSGEWQVVSTKLVKAADTATVDMRAQGILTIDPKLDFSLVEPATTAATEPMASANASGSGSGSGAVEAELITRTLTLTTTVALIAEPGTISKTIVATGNLIGTGQLRSASGMTATAKLSSDATFTATVESGFVITETTLIQVKLQIQDQLTATHDTAVADAFLAPKQIAANAVVSFTGTMAPLPPEQNEAGAGTMLWTQVSELLQTTVVSGWQSVQAFVVDLWEALPGWLQAILRPLYTQIILPIFAFVNRYLIQPLIYQTAEWLVKISGITLGVLALLLAWIYADRQMSNRETVRLTGTVDALAIRENGQIFAGTSDGVFRSLEDDPNAPLWKKVSGAIIRRAFPDVPMEPVNNGLLDDEEKPPAIQTLAIIASGDLLVATTDGRLFRSADNGDNWYRYGDGLTLEGITTILPTTRGQFAAGKVGGGVAEERWFTAQIKTVKRPEQPDITIGEIDLDRTYPDLKAAGWIVVRQPLSTTDPTAGYRNARYQIGALKSVLSQDQVTSGEFTRIIVEEPADLTSFSRAESSVLLQSDAIPLFDNRPVYGHTITLSGYFPELKAGQKLIISGQPMRALIAEEAVGPLVAENKVDSRKLQKGQILRVVKAPPSLDTPVVAWQLQMRDGFVGTVMATAQQIRWMPPAADDDREVSEVSVIETIRSAEEGAANEDESEITLATALTHAYDRATVRIFGNIIHVTHGQTVEAETLGSGSGMQANERFMLQEGPLTYVSATNALGVEGEIAIAVNGVTWEKVPYLYGLTRDQRAYVVQQDSLNNTQVIFGDGKEGARLPTGTEQVTATYRIGIGIDGNVPGYTIDQPQTLPTAVQTVTNPLPSTGGVGPDSLPEIQQRAPLSVRIMERIVALADYENFVRLYAGIGRVKMQVFDTGRNRHLYFTIADSAGNEIPEGADIIENLKLSIDEHRAVAWPTIEIASYTPLYFTIAATLLIDPTHTGRVAVIEQAAKQTLRAAFAFSQREFGQPVAESEVVGQLEAVRGVNAVQAVHLERHTATRIEAKATTLPDSPNELLPAALTRRVAADKIEPAQMLLLTTGDAGIKLYIATITEPTKRLNESERSA